MNKKDSKSTLWSFSRVMTFHDCPFLFYQRYIKERNDGEGNYYAELGKLVHKIYELVLLGKLDAEDAPMEFIMRYSDVNEDGVSEETVDKNFKLCLDAVSDIKIDEKAEILFVEKDLRGDIQGYHFRGLIDVGLKDKRNGQIMILDHKSAEYPLKKDGTVKANKEETFYKHKVQLYLYSELYKINYGVYPDYMAWNHFKTGQLLKYKFDPEECKEALDFLISIIHEIESTEVYEKNPSYLMENYLCEFRHNCWEL